MSIKVVGIPGQLAGRIIQQRSSPRRSRGGAGGNENSGVHPSWRDSALQR